MINIIPEVKNIKIIDDEIFTINHISLGNNNLSAAAQEDFISFCKKKNGEENIVFLTDESFEEEEYRIETGEAITITASTQHGQLYALQTLKQILFQTDFNIPHIEINDKPSIKLRGFMLDVGRYFFSVDDVKLFIRKMALHKLNLFHFHLTEDQGWRIEIDKYPRLTEIGSQRKKTNFNHTPHGGYYTKAQIKEIVDYAHAFSIKVMPEFDIPGHSRAAIAAYNELTCFPRALPVADHWGVKHDVLCVGNEKTMDFVYNVLDEFFEMFPDEYIHIGGDEVPKHRWDLCPKCSQLKDKLGCKNSDELQYYFMNKVKDYCKQHGRQAFMWSWDLENDEVLDEDLGFTKCAVMDTKNRPFIDTSTCAYYIDLPYGKISLEDSANHKGYDGNCIGVEATLWSEYVPDMKKADYMTYPRLGCMCETGWNNYCNWEFFSKKLDYYYSFLKRNNIGFAPLYFANPSKIVGKCQDLWFERRQLTWEGLTNIFDDKKIERIAKKLKP